ncbi:MAG: helix-turn-helix transcriptional regulator [Candidatus Eremiobacteraeota bacterium]|nr:helix-turn-helix transcriptional regulator [Candidatus Eremiobacteraeota bacterium]MBC5826714.1 helix-turn-helix transcriptional regulator [Candidatus Eremiobacteraeota bacterium]
MRSKDEGPWKGLGEFIRAQRELAKLSVRQLSEMAKISNPYLSQVERGLYKPSADVLKSIANALQMSAETMYGQAGLLDDDETVDDAINRVEAAIKLDTQLTTEQKDTMMRIYRGFTQR